MPLVKYDNSVGGLSGGFGRNAKGLVYYDLDGRGIARQAVVPKQPDSTDQMISRNHFKSLTLRFSQLTQQQAMAWKAFGARWQETDRLGRDRTVSSRQAFIRVNTHRLMVEAPVLQSPPEFVRLGAPSAVERVEQNTNNGALQVVLRHSLARDAGFWRLRLTATLPSPVRMARVENLRKATIEPQDSYFAIKRGPQTLKITGEQLRNPLTPGKTCGVEILTLSPEYVPGESLFVPWIVVE